MVAKNSFLVCCLFKTVHMDNMTILVLNDELKLDFSLEFSCECLISAQDCFLISIVIKSPIFPNFCDSRIVEVEGLRLEVRG